MANKTYTVSHYDQNPRNNSKQTFDNLSDALERFRGMYADVRPCGCSWITETVDGVETRYARRDWTTKSYKWERK